MRVLLARAPILLILIALNAWSQENVRGGDEGTPAVSGVNWGGEVDLNSRYVWRGIPWGEGSAMQPSAWASAYGVTLAIWGNIPLDHDRQINEVDLTASYELSLSTLSTSVALAGYAYPNQEDSPSTMELIVSLSHPIGSMICFSNQTFDVVEYESSYYGDVGLGYERELSPQWLLGGDVSLSWASKEFNEAYVGVPKAAVNAVSVNLFISYWTHQGIYFRSHVDFSPIVDEALRSMIESYACKPPAVFGLAVGLEF